MFFPSFKKSCTLVLREQEEKKQIFRTDQFSLVQLFLKEGEKIFYTYSGPKRSLKNSQHDHAQFMLEDFGINGFHQLSHELVDYLL